MTEPTRNAILRDQASQALDGLIEACGECRSRLQQSGQTYASDWMLALTESLLDVKRMIREVTGVLDAPPEDVPRMMRRLVSDALTGVGPHILSHLTQVEKQLDAAYPEPDDPKDAADDAPPWEPWPKKT